MRYFQPIALALALITCALTVERVRGQLGGAYGSRGPYWGLSPGVSRGGRIGTDLPSPAPGAPPAPSAYDPDRSYYYSGGAGLGGSYLPSFLTTPDSGYGRPVLDNQAHVWLRVPRDAEVWVDGARTRQTGASRHFYSPPLTPGETYTYQFRVRWNKDGTSAEETQQVRVYAGANVRLELKRFGKVTEGRPRDGGRPSPDGDRK
jgi:uncharacterized protein (TIGR03000 family)